MGGKMQVGLSSAVILLLSKPLSACRYLPQARVHVTPLSIRTLRPSCQSGAGYLRILLIAIIGNLHHELWKVASGL